MDRLELLAPAGDLEKLKAAVDFGADAVYFGGRAFSLRSGAGGLGGNDLKQGLDYAHERGRRCYMTLNIYAHEYDLKGLREYLTEIRKYPVDAFLVSDPGVLCLLKEEIPYAEIHLSTQANATNSIAANFWVRQGVKRIVLAREVSLAEIKEIRRALPPETELEAFCHGAMCIAYSGRCLLSSFMTGRYSNKGECAQPCRWNYSLQEEQRPGEFYPVEEDGRGTYIMNSRDLCMIDHIKDLAESGVTSFKIEGRMKTVFYVATVIRAYRAALDAYIADPANWSPRGEWMEELCKASHREFTTGFFFGNPGADGQKLDSSGYVRDYMFTGLVRSYDPASGFALVEQRNKMNVGETIELFGARTGDMRFVLDDMKDAETGENIESCPHPQQMILIKTPGPVEAGDMMRKRTAKGEENAI
ncbi:MAG: U32 family peptidase [Clostridia bacterium]|nr:U32 family peptidase [Clostridia bacterium]